MRALCSVDPSRCVDLLTGFVIFPDLFARPAAAERVCQIAPSAPSTSYQRTTSQIPERIIAIPPY
jgi:hypothetical protein